MRTPQAFIGLALSACALAVTFQEPAPKQDGPRTQESKPQEPEPLAVGDEAPTFTLNDQSGELVTIGGKAETWTVLAFYPKALTGG